MTGALVAYGSTRIKTFVRVQGHDSELVFLHTTILPDDLRVHLSRGIGAIRQARAAGPIPGNGPGSAGGPSPVDELTRLASLLEAGLLTRQEFEQLKAKIIAG